jgi:hypothetical protein
MDDARFDELCRRVEALEREKSRWKVIGVTSLALLGLVLCLGCPLSVGTAVLRGRHVREALQAEREAAEEARQAEERARRAAEDARQGAEKARQETERREKQAEKPPGTEK